MEYATLERLKGQFWSKKKLGYWRFTGSPALGGWLETIAMVGLPVRFFYTAMTWIPAISNGSILVSPLMASPVEGFGNGIELLASLAISTVNLAGKTICFKLYWSLILYYSRSTAFFLISSLFFSSSISHGVCRCVCIYEIVWMHLFIPVNTYITVYSATFLFSIINK